MATKAEAPNAGCWFGELDRRARGCPHGRHDKRGEPEQPSPGLPERALKRQPKLDESITATFQSRHCERSEAIQGRRTVGWIASLRSQLRFYFWASP